jgi:two-component system phosphate regulon sensor histidine kinase PhoR
MKTFLKIFLFTFIPMTILLLTTWYYSNNLTLETVRKETLKNLADKWELLALSDFPTNYNEKTHNFLKETTEKTRLRVTLIDLKGKVIDDSYFDKKGIEKLENHLFRPEIQDAINYGKGHAIRYSVSTHQDMLYYAKKYKDSILRIAYPLTYADQLKKDFKKQNITILIIVTIILVFLTAYIARRISMPVQKLNYIADEIEAGNKDIHFPRFKDKTMIKIAGIIYRIYSSMNEKQKLIEAEQEKLNHIFSILHQGIILLDKNNHLKHWNKVSEEYLFTEFKQDKNILENVTDFDALSFLRDILDIKEDKLIQKVLKGKTFEVDIFIMEQEKLLVFYDISERLEYENFKTELVANITHELKTPLAMIMGYAETILNNKELTEEQFNKFITTIYRNSINLNNLINDLLELHKLESEGNNFNITEAVHLPELIDEIKQRYSDTDKNIYIETNTENINILYEHIKSIITNLIDNAIKYSKGKNIYLYIDKKDDLVIIVVDDEGEAIPPKERNRIFERFYTIHKSKNRNETGTGLGLSIIKHIASIYNGKVELTSNKFGGNSFKVILKEKI